MHLSYSFVDSRHYIQQQQHISITNTCALHTEPTAELLFSSSPLAELLFFIGTCSHYIVFSVLTYKYALQRSFYMQYKQQYFLSIPQAYRRDTKGLYKHTGKHTHCVCIKKTIKNIRESTQNSVKKCIRSSSSREIDSWAEEPERKIV